MSPVHTSFGFEVPVPTAGYRWAGAAELKVRTIAYTTGRPCRDPGPYLVQMAGDGGSVLRRPTVGGTTFRAFAELPADDLDALTAFTNERGSLSGRAVESILSRSTEDVECRAWCNLRPKLAAAYARATVSLGADGHARGGYDLAVETLQDWQRQIVLMRTAVAVLDAMRAGDTDALRRLFEFERDPSPIDCWWIDTGRDLFRVVDTESHRAAHSDAIRYRRPILGRGLGSPHDALAAVALTWLTQTINSQLDGAASPQLVVGDDGQPREYLAPVHLLAAMWAEVYGAIAGHKNYRQCRACGKWFEISSDGGTARKQFCDDTCRMRMGRVRKDRALAIAAKGNTAREVVKQLAAEGIEADVSTVRGWIKNTKK